MSARSPIEWTGSTWNPLRGCVEISPGCKRCYARVLAERFRGVPGNAYEQGFEPRLVPDSLVVPAQWQKPRLIFVNSMSDLFLELASDRYIAAVADVMLGANWHTYQVLTKRAGRMSKLLASSLQTAAQASHIWWGVSVEDRKYGLPRIKELQESPARIRFLSIEPLLEDLGEVPLDGIDWVIVGGESGRGARPMKPDWVRSIRGQCEARGVPFFFKQWGGVQKKKAGRTLDGRTYDDMPAITIAPVPSNAVRAALVTKYRAAALEFSALLQLGPRRGNTPVRPSFTGGPRCA
jgi:protein gp37